MTFVESVKFCLTKGYVDFKGRASRSEFWWFALFGILVSFVLSFLETISEAVSLYYEITAIFMILRTIANLLLFLPNLAVATRRLHDLNLSGWWLFALYMLWVILFSIFIFKVYEVVIAFGLDPEELDSSILYSIAPYVIVPILIFIVSLIAYLILCMRKGTQGANRFGEDPLEGQSN